MPPDDRTTTTNVCVYSLNHGKLISAIKFLRATKAAIGHDPGLKQCKSAVDALRFGEIDKIDLGYVDSAYLPVLRLAASQCEVALQPPPSQTKTFYL